MPLKKSPEYRALFRRVADPKPIDHWQEDGFHFFVFQLVDATGARPARPGAPVAVFAMHPQAPGPISAVVVTPGPGGEDAEVIDLRHPNLSYAAPLAS